MTRPLLVGALLACALNASCALFRQAETPDYGRALPAGADALLLLGPDERRPDVRGTWFERDEIMPALERSLAWTRSAHSNQFFPIAGIDHERALQSLERFAELLETSPTADAFARAFEAEFDVYKSAGWDGAGGGVLFTAYCTPLLAGSLTPTLEFDVPLHALPPDLVKAPDGTILGQETPRGLRPYPTRREILRDPPTRRSRSSGSPTRSTPTSPTSTVRRSSSSRTARSRASATRGRTAGPTRRSARR